MDKHHLQHRFHSNLSTQCYKAEGGQLTFWTKIGNQLLNSDPGMIYSGNEEIILGEVKNLNYEDDKATILSPPPPSTQYSGTHLFSLEQATPPMALW